ncbi:dihydrofolate reductase family protein [Kribbella qitaiheensis]|uniref:dihydrofolate reductase family protein n=1 Tax=Kribbella qitaiheensis TaxID=1544730 RepID=UPI0036084D8F
MGKIVVVCNLTLDGVMQAPGRPDEDTRGGFEYGGWAVPYSHDAMGRVMGDPGAEPAALLLGRRTYEDFADFWPKQEDNPYTEALNRQQKYVVSNTLAEPLPWANSTVVKAADIPALEEAQNLIILGSGALISSIQGQIDEYKLLIHPLVLGTGKRLFDPAARQDLELTDSVTTTTGVIIATCRPAR